MLLDNLPSRKRRLSSRQQSHGGEHRVFRLNMLLLALALCASRSLALTSSHRHQGVNHLMAQRHCAFHSRSLKRIHHLDPIPHRQRRGHRLQGKSVESVGESYEDEDSSYTDDYDDLEIDDKSGNDGDDLSSDEYLEQLISDAMKEDEMRNNPLKPTDPNSSVLEETKRMMQQQQQQIDLLMKLVQKQQSHSATVTSSIRQKSVNVTPLKVMIFIDGTWLYYSLHGRRADRCSILPKFGKGWQWQYKVDWLALPRLICSQIEKQRDSQTSFRDSNRPLDVSRVMVFSSAKKETDPNSIRMRMFREMANANYDVHMMETVGKGEKCVDIQLAVEMLHYATVPNAYDMAVLLTGDKDFVPALVRTRQKGKEVVICSMKSGCNRVLYQSPHIRDYNIVWIEDFLDDLIVPIPEDERSRHERGGYVSVFTLMKIIRDYVETAPMNDWVSSRDIGKYLKSIRISDSNMLDELKQSHGGLRYFLLERAKSIFDIQIPEEMGQADHSFGVKVKKDSDQTLIDEFKRTQFFTREEKQFLEEYTKDKYLAKAQYSHTTYTSDEDYMSSQAEDEPPPDYSKMTVAELKEICRERNLLVSGKKSDLVQRLDEYQKEYEIVKQAASKRRRNEWKETPRKVIPRMQDPNNVYGDSLPQLDIRQTTREAPSTTRTSSKQIDPQAAVHLEALVEEYLTASGGVASSRDIGRYLAANSDSRRNKRSALTELKESYGSLLSFLNSRSLFTVDNEVPFADAMNNGFPIKLNKAKR